MIAIHEITADLAQLAYCSNGRRERGSCAEEIEGFSHTSSSVGGGDDAIGDPRRAQIHRFFI